MSNHSKRGPFISAGIFLGIGLGGFADGIIFHQILQIHNMLSSRIPPNTLVNAKINMAWDGYFHAAVWLMTTFGLYLLFKAGQQRYVYWSGKALIGSIILGWGLFNLVEGVINHQILGIHHVYEFTNNKMLYDLAFLSLGGCLFIISGLLIVNSAKSHLNN